MRIDWQRLKFLDEIHYYENELKKGKKGSKRNPNYEAFIEYLYDELREYDYWQKQAKKERGKL